MNGKKGLCETKQVEQETIDSESDNDNDHEFLFLFNEWNPFIFQIILIRQNLFLITFGYKKPYTGNPMQYHNKNHNYLKKKTKVLQLLVLQQ